MGRKKKKGGKNRRPKPRANSTLPKKKNPPSKLPPLPIQLQGIFVKILEQTTLIRDQDFITFSRKNKATGAYQIFIAHHLKKTTQIIDHALFNWIKTTPFLSEKARCLTREELKRDQQRSKKEYAFYYTFIIPFSQKNKAMIKWLYKMTIADDDEFFEVVNDAKNENKTLELAIEENPEVLLRRIMIAIKRGQTAKNNGKIRNVSKYSVKILNNWKKLRTHEQDTDKCSRLAAWIGRFCSLGEQLKEAKKWCDFALKWQAMIDIEWYAMCYSLLKDKSQATLFLEKSFDPLLRSNKSTEEKLTILQDKQALLTEWGYSTAAKSLNLYINKLTEQKDGKSSRSTKGTHPKQKKWTGSSPPLGNSSYTIFQTLRTHPPVKDPTTNKLTKILQDMQRLTQALTEHDASIIMAVKSCYPGLANPEPLRDRTQANSGKILISDSPVTLHSGPMIAGTSLDIWIKDQEKINETLIALAETYNKKTQTKFKKGKNFMLMLLAITTTILEYSVICQGHFKKIELVCKWLDKIPASAPDHMLPDKKHENLTDKYRKIQGKNGMCFRKAAALHATIWRAAQSIKSPEIITVCEHAQQLVCIFGDLLDGNDFVPNLRRRTQLTPNGDPTKYNQYYEKLIAQYIRAKNLNLLEKSKGEQKGENGNNAGKYRKKMR